MTLPGVLPDPAVLRFVDFETFGPTIHLRLSSTQASCPCPVCGRVSGTVHSRYVRSLQDLPISGRRVCVTIEAKRFFCRRVGCARRIFCERLPNVVRAGGRTSLRLLDALRHVGLLVSGETGARLLAKLGVRTSPDTLLRLARAALAPPIGSSLRRIGIDDFAFRRGHRYGTIVVDHERGRPVALLPDRDVVTVQGWLREHEGLEVITRDRANAYADACTWGAPQAVQVLDRWHLLRNLVDAFERIVCRHHAAVKRAARRAQDVPTGPLTVPTPEESPGGVEGDDRWRWRKERFDAVKERLRLGWSKTRIAHHLDLSRATIHAYARLEEPPGTAPRRPRGSRLDPFKAYIEGRWNDGCRNASLLYREIRRDGYDGSLTLVKDHVRRLRLATAPAEGGTSPPIRVPSPRSFVWWLLRPERLTQENQDWLGEVVERLPDLARAAELVRSGWHALRERRAGAFLEWLGRIGKDSPRELRRFAASLDRESRETRAALELIWSNGPVEGHVNRLKTIKRSMYGRAGFDLLAAKVLYAN